MTKMKKHSKRQTKKIEKEGKKLAQFMRERRDVLEAEEALKGSDTNITFTPGQRKTLALGISIAIKYVPPSEPAYTFLRQWLDILKPEGDQ